MNLDWQTTQSGWEQGFVVAVATACSLLKATFLASDGSALRSIRNPSLQGLMSGLGLWFYLFIYFCQARLPPG